MDGEGAGKVLDKLKLEALRLIRDPSMLIARGVDVGRNFMWTQRITFPGINMKEPIIMYSTYLI